MKDITDKIALYTTMRNIKVPLQITLNEQTHTLKIIALFVNTDIQFNTTTMSSMYEDAMSFIEEMNDQYVQHHGTFDPLF